MNSVKVIPEVEKFASIDMMRGIAILMVIFLHTASAINGNMIVFGEVSQYGRMGVQLFFVASAFTLCYSLDKRHSQQERIINFYIRRFFRIAPLYYIGIFIYISINSLLSLMKNGFIPEQYNLVNIMANVLLLNGLYPPANNNIVPGGWSIGTEILFYLVFPAIFYFYKLAELKLKNILKLSYLYVPLITLAIVFIAEYICLAITGKHVTYDDYMYFSLLNQLPVFTVGISLYFAYKNNLLESIKRPTVIISFVILSAISIYFFYFCDSVFKILWAPFTSALSFTCIFIFLQNNRNIKNSHLIKIGRYSYSCYILHFIPSIFITSFLSKKIQIINADISFIIFYIFSVLVAYFMSKLTNKYVEQRFIEVGKKSIQHLNYALDSGR